MQTIFTIFYSFIQKYKPTTFKFKQIYFVEGVIMVVQNKQSIYHVDFSKE